MFSLKTTIVSLFLATMATAQDPSELPECAQPCFIDNIPETGCSGQEDFECLCADSNYIDTVTTCVLGACSITEA